MDELEKILRLLVYLTSATIVLLILLLAMQGLILWAINQLRSTLSNLVSAIQEAFPYKLVNHLENAQARGIAVAQAIQEAQAYMDYLMRLQEDQLVLMGKMRNWKSEDPDEPAKRPPRPRLWD